MNMTTIQEHNKPVLRFPKFSEEWERGELGSISKYKKGYAFKSSDYSDNGVRIVRVSDLGKDKIKHGSNKIFIEQEKAVDYAQWELKADHIIVTTVGSKPDLLESAVGRGIFVDRDGEGLLNQNVLMLVNISSTSNRFLMGYINSDKYRYHIKAISRGNANQSNITVKELLQFKLAYPSLKEQQKIASFLTLVDTKIEQLGKKKTLLEKYKKGMMQKLFNQEFRFKDEQGNNYLDWEVKTLGHLGNFLGGGTPDTNNKEYWKGTIPWVSSSDIIEDSVQRISITRKISEYSIKNSATKIIPPNSLLIVSRVGVGKLAVSVDELCTSQDFCNFTPKKDDVLFFAYWMSKNKQKLLSLCQGTSIKGLTTKELQALKINLPCFDEQQKIANFLSSLDRKIDLVATEFKQAQTFKKGLLQQMFV